MSVRAKFIVDSVTITGKGEDRGYSIVMRPVVGTSEENKSFYKWTPGGSLQLSTINLKAGEQFEPGKEYYLDFTLAE